jgi:hypothetical protein
MIPRRASLLAAAFLGVSISTHAGDIAGLDEFKQMFENAMGARTASAFSALYAKEQADPQELAAAVKQDLDDVKSWPECKADIVAFYSLAEMQAMIKKGRAQDSEGRDVSEVFQTFINAASGKEEENSEALVPNIPIVGVVEKRVNLKGDVHPKSSQVVTSIQPVGFTKDKLRIVSARAKTK